MNMEIIRAYPLLFIIIVVLPVLGGIVTAYIGFDNLSERVKTDRHQAIVESSLTGIQRHLSEIEKKEAVIKRYEHSLQQSNIRDATIEAVLSQYDRQRLAAQRF